MWQVFKDAGKVLVFRIAQDKLAAFHYGHLLFGLVCTWLVGVGRYWDNPRAGLLQHLGIGSVVYIFVLSVVMWLVNLPFKSSGWRYRHVLTFIALTSPPAALYAIPVERYFRFETAITLNGWFLVIVAIWRVALWLFYLQRQGQLSGGTATVTTLFPLTAIVTLLTALNLEHVVFQVMAGLGEDRPSVNDGAYTVLVILSILSIYSFIPICIAYAVLAGRRLMAKKKNKK